MQAFLIFNTQIISIQKSPFNIGRALENDLVIQEPTISRKHSQIHRKGEHYHLVDLDSTGGTFLNGDRVSSASLRSGDSIVLASTALVFVDNAPQLSARAQDSTGQLKDPNPDTEPTVQEAKPDWRPKDRIDPLIRGKL
jgi:pSer/pThr/pTyr-binding forkhead associated (FHA) protein